MEKSTFLLRSGVTVIPEAATSAFPETTAVITESKLMSSMTSSLPVRRATSRMISGSMPRMVFPSRNS